MTRIEWRRWRWALAFLAAGPVIVIGPYMALKGGVGTKPGIARVLGLEPDAQPLALEAANLFPPVSRSIRPIDWRRPDDEGIPRRRHRSAFPARAVRIGAGDPAAGPRRAGFLSGDDPGRFGLCAGATACNGRLLHRATRAHSRHASHPGGRSRDHVVMERTSIPGHWIGLAREAIRPGPICQAVVVLGSCSRAQKIQTWDHSITVRSPCITRLGSGSPATQGKMSMCSI